MLSKFPRLIAVAIVVFIIFSYALRKDASRVFSSSPERSSSIKEQNGQDEQDSHRDQVLVAPTAKTKVHYADVPDTTKTGTTTTRSYDSVEPTGFPVIHRKTPYAYVFWATEDVYACSVLININRLRKLRVKHRIMVVMSKTVSKEYKEAFESLNATVSVQVPPTHPKQAEAKHKDVFLKLVTFNLHQIDPSLERVLILDADQLIVRNLDSIFELPEVDIAAPRAYWIGNHVFATSFMLVSLNDRIWRSVQEAMTNAERGWYDLDLLNMLFNETVLMLPGTFATINYHWEAWTVPSWLRKEPPITRQGMADDSRKAQLIDLWDAINVIMGKDEEFSTQTIPTLSPTQSPVEKTLQKRLPEGSGEEEKGKKGQKEEDGKAPGSRPDGEQAKKEDQDDFGKEDLGEIINPEEEKKDATPDGDAFRQLGTPPTTKVPHNKPETSKVANSQQQQQNQPPLLLQSQVIPPELGNPLPPYPYKADNHPLRGDLELLHNKMHVLHFTSLPRPWDVDIQKLRKDREMAHPLFSDQYKFWREEARLHCPKTKRPKKDGGPDEWEWFTFVERV